jgi:probable biosynthetic protein (TIGR04098 family)
MISNQPELLERLVAVIGREAIPAFKAEDINTPFENLGIDSFGMLTLRAEVENAFRRVFPDQLWMSISTPADLIRIMAQGANGAGGVAETSLARERRLYTLNMPQMALGGLSESWLFKEIGDVHWSMITNDLGVSSSNLKDAVGNRLYATFTRIRVAADEPLTHYAENEPISLEADLNRFGAGIFLSDLAVKGNGHGTRVAAMSSFSLRGEVGSNTSILKGQPIIPENSTVRSLDHLPEFARQYRARRASMPSTVIFECEYEILPGYDINGVGLLYFAAYPMINDICAARHGGRRVGLEFSTRNRDVFYFGNSNADDVLLFRMYGWHETKSGIEMEASLSRVSDGALIAYIATAKDRVGG